MPAFIMSPFTHLSNVLQREGPAALTLLKKTAGLPPSPSLPRKEYSEATAETNLAR